MGEFFDPEVLQVTDADAGGPLAFEDLQLPSLLVWEPQIIRIKERKVFSHRQTNAMIARARGSRIRLSKIADVGCEPSRDFRRLIGRTIVNYDDLGGRQGLGKDAIQSFSEIALAIVNRDDATDGWARWHLLHRLSISIRTLGCIRLTRLACEQAVLADESVFR